MCFLQELNYSRLTFIWKHDSCVNVLSPQINAVIKYHHSMAVHIMYQCCFMEKGDVGTVKAKYLHYLQIQLFQLYRYYVPIQAVWSHLGHLIWIVKRKIFLLLDFGWVTCLDASCYFGAISFKLNTCVQHVGLWVSMPTKTCFKVFCGIRVRIFLIVSNTLLRINFT